MSDIELSTAYEPRSFEERLYRFWLDRGLFAPDLRAAGDPYVIVIPPPNVTGVLHMGHGLNNCLQDVLVRYHRMLGQPTLWLPGADHAGIATQNVVERRLARQGRSRQQLGRERFLEETWKVKEEHHRLIVRQLQRIGSSCDWGRERFTLDEGLSRAVREVFVALHEKGLIYRGNYLVNWCPSCGTAISDDEVEHEEIEGRMYRYRYPLADGDGSIQIATTRPETMLGDAAVAVHPEDRRYRRLVGAQVHLPLTGRQIPIVADGYVDMEFGTGMVKVTPAHDPNDYQIGTRHDLPRINILNPDGTLNENVPERYRGLTALQARERVVADLKAAGLMVREEVHRHQVGHCYRCHTVIEPFLSDQWFVRMQPLAAEALQAWERGEVVFYPQKWENTYTHWLRNIRDWCISRQLWWGHRIPVWYCAACGGMTVNRQEPEACAHCGAADIRQDPDVLDTWFSSALWPFSTLGWPERTPDLERFYPTSTLVTGYDIIFFWVARMIMMGRHFMGRVPFRDVYIHGLVRDIQGRKMSKSLGNGIDPLEVVERFGADALKFTIAFLTAQGQDILVNMDSFRLGSKFANKVWNAARFILMNLNGGAPAPPDALALSDVDRWILHRLNETVRATRAALDQYRFNDAAGGVYDYFWGDFCDWYIEACKLRLQGGDARERDRALGLLLSLLGESLALLHPFLPFVTEELYQKLPVHEPALAAAPYPEFRQERVDAEAAGRFARLQDLVRAIRTVRSEFTVPAGRDIRAEVRAQGALLEVFRGFVDLISLLAGCRVAAMGPGVSRGRGCIPVAAADFEAFLYLQEAVDLDREVARLNKELAAAGRAAQAASRKLGNQAFLSKAPPEVVGRERARLGELQQRRAKIREYLADLDAGAP